MIAQLTALLLGVTPGPGWSYPIVVTEEPNSNRPGQFIEMDVQGRFHLVWEDYKLLGRIGYKVFLLDGTTVIPDTMISRDTICAYLRTSSYSDSLYAFWREYNPVYYSIQSLEDGSGITPATYLFTEYTYYPHIRACPDSLGRLHTLRNIGQDLYYAVWTPAPGSGFIEEYGWFVPDVFVTGVLLVDGDRVHVVVELYSDDTLHYTQFDLEGNVAVPMMDFTADDHTNTRFPELAVDSSGNLIVVDDIGRSGEQYRFALWKLDGETGELLIDEKWLVISSPPEIATSVDCKLLPLPGNDQFYLVWRDGYIPKEIWFIAFDSEGNLLFEPSKAYDHSDEDPEEVLCVDGVVDSEGNLYIIYAQIEDEPIFGTYPTFGWFDHTWLGLEDEEVSIESAELVLYAAGNPFTELITINLIGDPPEDLGIFDITGRRVATLYSAGSNTAHWNGQSSDGIDLPSGTYIVRAEIDGIISSLKLLKLE